MSADPLGLRFRCHWCRRKRFHRQFGHDDGQTVAFFKCGSCGGLTRGVPVHYGVQALRLGRTGAACRPTSCDRDGCRTAVHVQEKGGRGRTVCDSCGAMHCWKLAKYRLPDGWRERGPELRNPDHPGHLGENSHTRHHAVLTPGG